MNNRAEYEQVLCINAQNDDFENWDEIRTAYQVARLGTLSAAAAQLGVHHATVIRHIDALEARLGCKLFQRHARGYTPTEAGQDLLKVGAATEDQFAQLSGRLRGKGAEVSGELIVTMLSGLSPWLTPVLGVFQAQHPDLRLTVMLDERLLRLEYGEAHLAIRAGPKPTEPDNIVRLMGTFPVSLFAHRDYVARYGTLKSLEGLAAHRFVSGLKTAQRSPLDRWLGQNVPEDSIAFRASEPRSQSDAVIAGVGIGFLMSHIAAVHPDLVMMTDPLPEWQTPIWLVTHMAIHRTAKMQAISGFLSDNASVN
ncbi:MAG: LysR family transcriptional regulator [Proteobacteria bacterium]|nr:LysR family transcriptional regulator [Pseudomonadota bacterium]